MKNNIYLIDKPAGITSFDVVRDVRNAVGIRRVGHTGTLDPFATGLLIVATGPFTRLTNFFHIYSKTYIATIQLGVTTDSDDMSGKILEEKDPSEIRESELLKALENFRGEILQRPPSISAKRVNGKRLYRANRNGVTLAAKSVPVFIHGIRVIELALPCVTLEIKCGTGTYIRSIARDLGEVLGVGGAVQTLRRTEIGPYNLTAASSLDDICPIAHLEILPDLDSFSLGLKERAELSAGKSILLKNIFLQPEQRIRIFGDYFKTMTAICRVISAGTIGSHIQPEKVFGE